MASDLHDSDFFAWTQAQTQAVRDAGSRGNLPVDWHRVAEEIEALGARDRRELASRVASVIEHLLTLQVSPAAGPGAGWVETVLRSRAEIELPLEASPSLRREVPAIVAAELPRAARLLGRILAEYGELSPATATRLSQLSYGPDQVLDDWWPPLA